MIVFRNPGVIDPRLIQTFGVNVKETDDAIGFFGTGFKYAIAVLLRCGCSITVIAGQQRYQFSIIKQEIRGKTFDVVAMNGEPMAFTTELGKKWELWMAYRELYSNCIDEGGAIAELHGHPKCKKDETVVIVEGAAFDEVYRNRGLYILDSKRTPTTTFAGAAQAYPKMYGNSDGIVYYRGIRVRDLTNSIYDYNIVDSIDLTEDRTAKYGFQISEPIARMWLHCQDYRTLSRILVIEPGGFGYEQTLRFHVPYDEDPPEAFLDIIERLIDQGKKHQINGTALDVYEKARGGEVLPEVSVPLNAIQHKQLERAVRFCESALSYSVTRYPIIIAESLGNGVLGQADMEGGRIYVSKKAFDKGTKTVACALVEEFVHLDTGCADESIDQKWSYLDKIITLGEEIQGEPL